MADTLQRAASAAARRLTATLATLLLVGGGAAPALAAQDVDDRLDRTGVVTDLKAGVPKPPAPQSTGWLLADLDSGEVLAAQGAHTKLLPASTLKVLTALALTADLDGDTVYTARDADAAIDGSKVGLVPGSRYTVNDMLNGLMLGSGNDCAEGLAAVYGGDKKAVAQMNAVAKSLGATDTTARTPSGLDAPGQVSTVYDLALIARAALDDPKVGKVMATQSYSFPAEGRAIGAGRKKFQIQNHNKLLGFFPGATGGKTGFTQAARQAFVGSAERGGKRYVVTILHGEGRPWQQAGELLEWAFRYGGKAAAVGELRSPDAAPDGKEQDGGIAVGSGDSALLASGKPGDTSSSLGVPGFVWAIGAALLVVLVVWTTTDGFPMPGTGSGRAASSRAPARGSSRHYR
jgi:D-alanyl-D-alanine carboxypeptidase (penicillin-binding protein 5/6)